MFYSYANTCRGDESHPIRTQLLMQAMSLQEHTHLHIFRPTKSIMSSKRQSSWQISMVQLKVERTAGIHAKGANVPASASLMGGESKFVMSWAVGGNGASRSPRTKRRRTNTCWIIERTRRPGDRDSERSCEQGLPDELAIYNFL